MKPEKPWLSIIIPYYNIGERLLDDCLESIRQQGLSPHFCEVIVVDDGSDTPPTALIGRYQQEEAPFPVRYICQEHKGPGGARNTGLQEAQGEFIFFMDGDDRLLCRFLAQTKGMAKRTGCDLLEFGYRVIQEKEFINGPLPEAPSFRECPTESGEEYMTRRPLQGVVWRYLFSRSLLQRALLHFDENTFIEDEYFTTLLYHHAKRIQRCPLPFYGYRKRAGSITQTPSEERQRELYRCHLAALDKIAAMRQHAAPGHTAGLDKKLMTLAIDSFRRLLREANPSPTLSEHIDGLRRHGLYPLKSPGFGWQYALFCHLANCPAGLWLLQKIERNRKQ